jgi:phosphoglycerol transferase MdoB-like AlkP superfamily enzyme
MGVFLKMKRQKEGWIHWWIPWLLVLGLIVLIALPLLLSFLIFDYVLIPLDIAELHKPWPLIIFISLPIFFFALEIGLIYLLFYLLVDKPSSQKTSRDRSSAQLKNLNEARKTLAASLKHLDKLSRAIQDSQKKQEELTLLVESLKETSHESALGLKKKLAAIDFVNRRKEYWRYIVAFILGIIASLMATFIWSLLSTNH